MNLSTLVRLIVIPFLLMLNATIAYLAVGNQWSFELTASLIFVLTAIYIFIFEQLIPFKPHWNASRYKIGTDLKHLLLSTVLFDALGKTMALSFVLWVKKLFFQTVEFWELLPMIIVFVIAVLLGELLPYLYHRISHVGKKGSYWSMFLWKIHSIHHLPSSLNWFKTNWMHPINMFLNSFLKLMPLLLLGFSPEIIFLVGILHVVIAYISHANIDADTFFLDYLVVTPKIHRFHHSKILAEAKNFGNIVPFWDLLFRTYYNRRGEVDQVGVLESHIDYPKNEAYLNQMTFPFTNIFKDCCQTRTKD